MFDFLQKPYPSVIEDGFKKPNLINLLISVVVVAFLYLFKPTNLFYSIKINFTFLNCLMFGGITLATASVFTNILPQVFKDFFHYKNWTVGKEIVFIIALLLSISTLNFLISWWVFYESTSFKVSFYFQALLNTFAISIFPVFMAISINLITSQKKAIQSSITVNSNINKQKKGLLKKQDKIIINGYGKFESLELQASQLVFIESSGNYSDIYYLNDKLSLNKITFRITLHEIENQLANLPSFFRSHRSYILNINKVINSKGNAQGYQLTLEGVDDKQIPVSRAKISSFNSLFDN